MKLCMTILALCLCTMSALAQSISATPTTVTFDWNSTVTITGVSTTWTKGSSIFSTSGAGCSLSNPNIVSDTVATMTLTVGNVNCPITDSSTGLTTIIANPRAVQTWHINKIGGPRFSANNPTGTCDGTANTSPVGTTPNQKCAFNDVRYMWQDGSEFSYFNIASIMLPGDTMLLHGSIADGVDWRIGWAGLLQDCDDSGFPCFGFAFDPSDSGMPPPPSGSPAHHTRILGGNFASCLAPTSRTQLHGGHAGVSTVMNVTGARYLDVACLDVTDYSACGQSGQVPACTGSDDFAQYGIRVNNQMDHLTVTDVNMHGLSVAGMLGPTGDGAVFTDVDWLGNAGAGWNADDGTVGNGSLLVNGFEIAGNGCAEEYPIIDAFPYNHCTDDQTGGYGDGFGTTTQTGLLPWLIKFYNGIVRYNTQDGLDGLHAQGAGSSMTVDRVLAYGNMGQQVKVGSDGGTYLTNSLIFANCDAMSFPIVGFPSGYNATLKDKCRAGDESIIVSVINGGRSVVAGNVFYGERFGNTTENFGDLAGIVCAAASCGDTALITYADNIIVGFDPLGTGTFPAQYFLEENIFTSNPFTNPGSIYSNNLHYNLSSACPDVGETNAICAKPDINNVTWPSTGTVNVQPISLTSNVVGAGIAVGLITDFTGGARLNPTSIGAYEFTPGPPAVPVVNTPTSTPAAGLFTSPLTVSLSTNTIGATICTTMGTAPLDPTANIPGVCDVGSTTYTGFITISATSTLKAIATFAGDTNSSVFSGLYTINIPPPVVTPGIITINGNTVVIH